MLVPKKNRLEVYKYLFKGARLLRAPPAPPSRPNAACFVPKMCDACFSANRHVSCAEGVCFAEKDFNLPQHPEINVPNLHVRSRRLTCLSTSSYFIYLRIRKINFISCLSYAIN